LKAMISARRPQDPGPEKKKEPKKASKEESMLVKRFSYYNFSPINKRAVEVLAVIKGDPKFCRAPKIIGTPSPCNKNKYHEYHEVVGHTTEGCIALRMLIEKFNANGKLIRFIGKQRAQQANDRPRYQP
jgi:hypothetical protein